MDLLTAAEMRATERAAIGEGSVTGLELMERAGRGVVEALLAEWPRFVAPRRAVVLGGPGNNGGDGFVVARLLKERGWAVALFLLGEDVKLPADAAANAARWRALGPVRGWSEREIEVEIGEAPDLVVDALFGTGLRRALDPALLSRVFDALKDHVHVRGLPAVAVDIPSGLSSETGRVLGFALPAALTVTFHRPKPGHFLAEGPETCGRLRVADIGLTQRPGDARLRLTEPPRWWAWEKARAHHKYDHGHALVLGGGVGRGGAARLAAKGALRVGAGLVTLAPPPAALIENAARLDAVMLRPVAGAEALAEVLGDARITALCLGPGLGLDRARALVPAALAAARPTVLDADALTAFTGDPPAFLALLHDRVVLTPHAGEFGRLFPDLKARLDDPDFSKVDAVREAAARAGCTVLLKGADTVIAEPSGRALLNAAAHGREAPWLATAGSGDVLAGFIAGLLARGLPPVEAAGAAAWLHVECARSFGPGLIAEDLPDELPKVLRGLGL